MVPVTMTEVRLPEMSFIFYLIGYFVLWYGVFNLLAFVILLFLTKGNLKESTGSVQLYNHIMIRRLLLQKSHYSEVWAKEKDSVSFFLFTGCKCGEVFYQEEVLYKDVERARAL